MSLRDDHTGDRDRTNPMGLVVAVCLVIGAIGYVLVGLIGGPQEAGFWLFAGIGGILVYILTFIDLRIGISVMILAIGISPEMSVEGVPNIRIENGEADVMIRVGWYRSVNNIQHAYAQNCFANELAEAARPAADC